MSKIVIGGNGRVGAGGKKIVNTKTYDRSTHDLSYKWRSTMSAGTLVPFMSRLMLNGDTWDLDLDIDVLTNPTIGPLFGSYKVQVDVYECPIRLYQGKLHMNMLGIGLDMSQVKLPQIYMNANGENIGDTEQINPSCIFSYLGIKGLGKGGQLIAREFNAVPYLAYWDIYKNYYANKQEKIGAVVHNNMNDLPNSITYFGHNVPSIWHINSNANSAPLPVDISGQLNNQFTRINFANQSMPDLEEVKIVFDDPENEGTPIGRVYNNIQILYGQPGNPNGITLQCNDVKLNYIGVQQVCYYKYNGDVLYSNRPNVTTFDLENLDTMRMNILKHVDQVTPFIVDENSMEPYYLALTNGTQGWCKEASQEGLAIKTYQSDLFNNWVNTGWIDGAGGVNEITKVSTATGSFSIDSLNIASKVYEMLNGIAMSGGTYDDWQNVVYDHKVVRRHETPMYLGGMSRELAFQEVISNTATNATGVEQPLGTLAGRGVMTNKKKGGKITIRVDEPSYVIGIVSLTPRVDYSQGNDWDVNLKTMNDLHKPALDEIGFQDLITDQMAWWDTVVQPNGSLTFKSAGKVPAWLNYMTDYNRTYGNFAEKYEQMFMTLNRRYEQDEFGNMKDLTTYIDPQKFNNIFADTRRDAQNFWVQMSVNAIVRRKMSAKIMPNL